MYRVRTFLFGKKECGKNTKRCRYHGPCCTKNLKLILEYADRLFRENGITYWLDYGTLHGALREKDGFVFRKENNTDFYRIAFSEKNALHADVFLWKRYPDGVLYREDYMKKDAGKGRDFPEDLILKLEEREIDGRMYPVPSGPEEFCRFRFGDNWRERIRYNDK